MDKEEKVEFIESYIKVKGGDYKWNDNHGELIRCRDCKFHKDEEYWLNLGGVPVLGTDHLTCTRWCDGDCATSPDGYCYLAERW